MGNYSIKELEKLSGIKAHTIRIWEKRHSIIEPARTDTNIRYYSDEDLKKILNVSILNNHGFKISQIASLTRSDLVDNVKKLSEEKTDTGIYIDQLTLSMIDFDEPKFEKLLAGYILKLGFERTLLEVVYPFLTKIGVLWLSNNISPIQEHFITNLIRQKIVVAIDGITTKPAENAKKVVLFLPENEMHEIGLLFFHYLLKNMGFLTYYLGQYVPLADLERSVKRLQPDYLVASISYSPSLKQLNKFLTELNERFTAINIYITGRPVLEKGFSEHTNLHFFKDAAALKEEFTKL
ncbi:MAG: MerR family transcriptional regulator [Bacteroidota bacterium]